MNDINLELLGEFGQSIMNFNINNYRDELLTHAYNALQVYKKDYEQASEFNDLASIKNIEKTIEYYGKVLSDKNFLNIIVSWNLNCQVNDIIRVLNSRLNQSSSKILSLPTLNFLGKANDLNNTITLSDGNKITIGEAIKQIPLEELRKQIFKITGLEYTSLDELEQLYKTSPIEQKEDIRNLFHKNGYTLHKREDNKHDGINLQGPLWVYINHSDDFDKSFEHYINKTKLIKELKR